MVFTLCRLSLRLLHLHLNTLGFIGLTAIGTLQVLMPTILAGPDGEASARLRDDLLPAVGGVFLVALGAAVWSPAWWFVRGFYMLFLRISQGASRLQEVMADRWAAFSYGAQAFESGLRHALGRLGVTFTQAGPR